MATVHFASGTLSELRSHAKHADIKSFAPKEKAESPGTLQENFVEPSAKAPSPTVNGIGQVIGGKINTSA